MKELVSYVAKAIVEHPDQVEVTETETAEGVQILLKVAEADKGKVIGKQGKVIKAMRALLAVPAAKADKRVSLDVA